MELPARSYLSVVMPGSIDAARGDVLPAVDHAAMFHREAAVVASAHATNLTMNARLLPLKSRTLARSECAISDTVADASLLVELALDDRVFCMYGRGLGECKGGRCCQCRHKHIFK
jgi:hypothetical protein